MAQNKRGRQSFVLPGKPVITHWAGVAGKRESEGPLGHYFDRCFTDNRLGQKTWEAAERELQQQVLQILLEKAGVTPGDIGPVLSGDLLNQCIGSSFPLRNTGIPHLGLYGACSTMAEALALGAMVVEGGFSQRVVAMTSSHFAASERQYRFPLGYGGQRTPTSQWTVTGAGAAMLSSRGAGPRIESCTLGTVTDLEIRDANNMGAAMAPAALATIKAHFSDLQTSEADFDLILTGDLGQVGKECLLAMARKEGLSLGGKLQDCGTLVFDRDRQDVHAGGSGCGCSAVTLCAHILDQLNRGKLRRVLFCGTGALLSPTSASQGQPIPGICHGISIIGGQ